MNPNRRTLLLGGLASGLSAPFIRPARAQRPFTMLTNWYAQPDQGGFYQAQATGLYRDAGLNVAIQSGAPQLNVSQMLLTGAVDAIIGFDTQVLTQVSRGIPVVTVAAMFQYDQEGMLVHDDIQRMEDLKDHTLMIATNSQGGFWPWLKLRFGFTDDQLRPYNNDLQPFLLDPRIAAQAIATAEPCEMRHRGIGYKFFPFHDYGYPTYSCTVVTRRDVAEGDPSRLRAFLEASITGYRDYLRADPAPANRMILQENRSQNETRMSCAVDTIKATGVCFSGDAVHGGIGIMTEERWRATAAFMVKFGLIPPQTDWHRAFSLDYLPTRPILL